MPAGEARRGLDPCCPKPRSTPLLRRGLVRQWPHMSQRDSTIPSVLDAAARGDPKAAAQLLPLVYRHLHDLAQARMREEGVGNTLQATALVHEAYLRLSLIHISEPTRLLSISY